MMMSVFRQGSRYQQLDHLACVDIAVDDEAAQMVLFARLQNQRILVGLEGGEAIIKPLESGDACLSFEGLYDTCISLREYRKMQELKVTSPTDFPPSVYELELVMEVGFMPKVRLRILAKNDVEVRRKLTALLNTDEAFREQLTEAIAVQLFTSDYVDLKTAGSLKIADVAPAGTADWEIIKAET